MYLQDYGHKTCTLLHLVRGEGESPQGRAEALLLPSELNEIKSVVPRPSPMDSAILSTIPGSFLCTAYRVSLLVFSWFLSHFSRVSRLMPVVALSSFNVNECVLSLRALRALYEMYRVSSWLNCSWVVSSRSGRRLSTTVFTLFRVGVSSVNILSFCAVPRPFSVRLHRS